MTTETKADEFKVGDLVWCLVYGEGKVASINDRTDTRFPILVRFIQGEEITYKETGEFYYTSKRTLFFSEPKIEASVTRQFVPTLVGKTVMLHTKAYGIHNGEITSETQDALVVNYAIWNKSGIEAIYEVSSENLLK